MLNPDVQSILATSKFCQCLEPSELNMLVSQNKVMSFAMGEIILQQGRKSDGMYIVIQGEVVVVAKVLGEGTTNIATLGPGNFLGDVGLIDKSPAMTTMIANSEVDCLFITNTYYEMLSCLYPKVKHKLTLAITKQVCDRLQNLHDKIVTILNQTDAPAKSFFAEVVGTLTLPKTISFTDANLQLNRLRLAPFFKIFTADEFDALMNYVQVVEAKERCVLRRVGGRDLSCFILLNGAVQSSFISHNRAAKISVFGPISIFTGVSAIDTDKLSIIDFTTCERALLFKIPAENLQLLQKNHLTLWYKLFDCICQSFAALERSADKLDIRLHSELFNR